MGFSLCLHLRYTVAGHNSPVHATMSASSNDGDDDWYTTSEESCDSVRPFYEKVNNVVISQAVLGGVGVT